MNMKKAGFIKIFALLLLLYSPALQAAPAETLLDSANSFYISNQFDKAAELYLAVVQAGYEASELYYNLGNSYFKMDQIAMAILYYEKALKLDPYDNDTKNNLNMSYSRTADKIETIPEFFLKKWWKAAYNLLLPDIWAVLSISALVLSLLLFFLKLTGIKVFQSRMLLPAGIVTLLLALLFFTFSLSRKTYIDSDDTAIITDLSIGVKSSPEALGTSVFVLHEGTKVTILDSLDNWKEIMIGNGNIGWVPGTSMAGI